MEIRRVRDAAPLPANWPIELRFLVECLCRALGTLPDAGAGPAAGDFDWDAWVHWVMRHRVAGFLHQRLPEAARAALPISVAETLRCRALMVAKTSLAQVAETTRLFALFDAGGIRVIGLKGLFLAQQLYGRPGVRHAGDIDVLVAPADVAAADALLRGAGYLRSYPDFELTPLQWEKFLCVEHELNHVHPQSGLVVELQWRLDGLADMSFEQCWSARSVVSPAGKPLATLSEDTAAHFLFAHGARHAWSSMFWLLDAAIYLRQSDALKARTLLAAAYTMGTRKALLQGWCLACNVLRLEPPEELINGQGARSMQRGLVFEATRRMREPRTRQTPVWRFLRNALYDFQLQETWRSRGRVFRRWQLSPQNWKEFPLPDRWFWVYSLASPVLWALRRLKGMR